MSSKIQKKARAQAYRAVTNQALWQKGKESLLAQKWYYPLAYRLSKKFKKRANEALASWYRKALKDTTAKILSDFHDPDRRSFLRARAKVARTLSRKETGK